MGFGMFREVKLTGDGTTLQVVGRSDPFHGSEVHVAIHAVQDVRRRIEGKVPTPIRSSSWRAVLEQNEEQPFVRGEKVFVVGQAMSPKDGLFLWADIFNLQED
jgi:hypothetical protein